MKSSLGVRHFRCIVKRTHYSGAAVLNSVNVNVLITKSIVVSRTYSSKSKLNSLLLDMETKAAHVPNMKAARLSRKEKTGNYPAGSMSLKVLGTGAEGSPPALYMFADQSRYLFNCGEGTQRLAHEHKQKLGRLEHIFLTSKSWNKIGGLLGVALTVQDIGVPHLTLHGPPGLDDIFNAAKRFVMLKELEVKAAACLTKPCYEDHIMQVNYVPVFSSKERTSAWDTEKAPGGNARYELSDNDRDIDYYSHVQGGKRKVEVTREAEADGNKKRKSDGSDTVGGDVTGNADCIMCYICWPKRKQGRLLVDKCIKFGVPPGPLLGKLKAGEDVTLPNGNVVRAVDVRGPDFEDVPFVVADCPTEDYLQALITNSKWEEVQNLEDGKTAVRVVVHFTPKQIYLNPKYQEWMKKFGPTTDHLLLNESCSSFGSEAVHRLQTKLNMVDDSVFPLLYHENERTRLPIEHDEEDPLLRNYRQSDKPVVFSSVPKPPSDVMEGNSRVMIGEPLAKYVLRPNTGADSSESVSLCMSDYVEETMSVEGFHDSLKSLKQHLLSFENSVGAEYPRIVFLGTGSCIPNKGRNVSGICVELDTDTRILLDCGEGTCGQLYRFYGPKNIRNVLQSIKGIYVSHMHADHHLGLLSVLQARYSAFKNDSLPFEPASLFAPVQIVRWLHLFDLNFEEVSHLYNLVSNVSLLTGYDGPNVILDKESIFHRLNLSRIETCHVRHCPNSFGVLLEHLSGWKICYSGDTMPCDNFVTLGMNSDICIHEATMEDELEYEAKVKQHCTTSQAIEVGNKMKTKFLLLTHFSQRYAKVPKINAGLAPHVGIAFDNMVVRPRDLAKIPLMYPVFKAMFAEHYEEMEAKTLKKMQQKELKL